MHERTEMMNSLWYLSPLSRYGPVHYSEQFWQQAPLLDFLRLVSSLSQKIWIDIIAHWLCSCIDFLYILDTMACTWWDRCRGVWWNDIPRNQEEHARGVWVCLKLVISLIWKLNELVLLDKKIKCLKVA